MASRKLLYEAGAKKVFESDSEDHLIFAFTDNFMATDGVQQGKIKGKSAMNNAIAGQIFEYLESYNVPTHFISNLNEKEMQVKNLNLLPVDVVISNSPDKSLCKRYGFEEGKLLHSPVIEYYYKNDKFKNPLVNESHLSALKIISQEEVFHLGRSVSKVNAVLKPFFERRNLILTELHLQLGRYKGYLLIGDEITPDTCQFWGTDNKNTIDKDVYRFDKGNLDETYNKLVTNIMGGA